MTNLKWTLSTIQFQSPFFPFCDNCFNWLPFPQTSSLSLPHLSLCIILANNLITYFPEKMLSHLMGTPSFSNIQPTSIGISFTSSPAVAAKHISLRLRPKPLSVLRSLPLLFFQESTLWFSLLSMEGSTPTLSLILLFKLLDIFC